MVSTIRAELNRRREERTIVRWEATWHDPNGGVHSGEICDVSSRGVFLKLVSFSRTLLLPVGTRIKVEFMTPTGAKIEAEGTMRWSGLNRSYGSAGYGIEFDQTNTLLREYLSAHA